MIVLPDAEGLTLVRQRDHAALSAGAAQAWQRPAALGPRVWGHFIEALRRHDDGWDDAEERPPLDPQGCPFDFRNLPVELHTAVWRRSVELVEREHPYVGLLIAQHSRWLCVEYGDDLADSNRGTALGFVADMDDCVDARRRQLEAGDAEERLAAAPEALLAARKLFSFFDGISLRLLGAIRMRVTEPLAFGGEAAVLDVEVAAGAVSIHPWPFREPALDLEATAVRVPSWSWASPEVLALAIAAAPKFQLRRELHR